MTNPSLSEAVERVRRKIFADEGGHLHVWVAIEDLRTILQSLSVDEEVIARTVEICAQIADEYEHEGGAGNAIRKNARAVLDTMGMANART
jgi:hypothetical protein